MITENDICNQLLAHWAEQNKPHLDDEDKCCYVLAVRAVNEIRRLRAEVEALRALCAEANKYLDTNNLTSIGHGSILHRKFSDAARKGE